MKVGDKVKLRPDFEQRLGVEECLGDVFGFDGEPPQWVKNLLAGEVGVVEAIYYTDIEVRFPSVPAGSEGILDADDLVLVP